MNGLRHALEALCSIHRKDTTSSNAAEKKDDHPEELCTCSEA
jgi:hypothetical protein